MKCGSEYLPSRKIVAINNIKTFINIGSYGITLEKGYEFATSEYIRSKDSTAVVYINPEIIKRQKILNINAFITRDGIEKKCISVLQKVFLSMEGRSFEVLNANFFKLDKFKGYLVSVILCGGK